MVGGFFYTFFLFYTLVFSLLFFLIGLGFYLVVFLHFGCLIWLVFIQV